MYVACIDLLHVPIARYFDVNITHISDNLEIEWKIIKLLKGDNLISFIGWKMFD